MIAIITHYHGPTNTRGSKIIASVGGRRVTHPYDHSLSPAGNHASAARAWTTRHLCSDYLSSQTLLGGEPSPGTMVWVFADSPDRVDLTDRTP